MPSLVKLLALSKKEVVTGEVTHQKADGVYTVKVGRRILSVPSLLSERIQTNSQVIIAQTEEGMYIINKERIKDRQKLEVYISG